MLSSPKMTKNKLLRLDSKTASTLELEDDIFTDGDGIGSTGYFRGVIKKLSRPDDNRLWIDVKRSDGIIGRADGLWRITVPKDNASADARHVLIIDLANAPELNPSVGLKAGDLMVVDSFPEEGEMYVAISKGRICPHQWIGNGSFGESLHLSEIGEVTDIRVLGNIPFRCVVCGGDADRFAHDGNALCREHTNYDQSNGSICESCGLAFRRREIGQTKCNWCQQMRTNYLELKNHSFKPAPKFYYEREDKLKKEKLFLGAEVETECTDERIDTHELTQKIIRVADDDNNWLYAKTDGSLHHGIEFVTHPATLTRHYTLPWEKFLRTAIKYNCIGDNPRCGLHIHASRGAMSQEDEMKLGYFVYTHKAKMTKIAGRSSSYAKFHTSVDDNPEVVKSTHDRYVALNWQNVKTVEFRLFRGTTDFPTIMACLECVHSLVYFVKRVSMDDLKDKRKAWKKYLEYVASKDYKFLKEHFNKVFAKPKNEGDEEDE